MERYIWKKIKNFLKLDEQLDYSKKDTVKKYYMQIIQRDLLTTSIGKKYRRRLEQIVAGETDNEQCLFCSGKTKNNTVICLSCAAKIKQPTQPQQPKTSNASAPVYCRSCGSKMNAESTVCPSCRKAQDEGFKYCAHCGNEVPMPNWETLTNDVKNKSKVFADQAAKIAKENVQNIAKQGEKIMGDITAGVDVSEKRKVLNKRNIIILAVILLVAGVIVKTVGLAFVFGFLALVSFAYLVYKMVKKEPKKKAVIAFAVCFVLFGIAGMGSSGRLNDDILDYMGANERAVYRVYGKDGIVDYGDFSASIDSVAKAKGLPIINLDGDPKHVSSLSLTSDMNTSLNKGGLHINEDISKMKKCMNKLNTTLTKTSTIRDDDYWTYHLKYRGKNIEVLIISSYYGIVQVITLEEL